MAARSLLLLLTLLGCWCCSLALTSLPVVHAASMCTFEGVDYATINAGGPLRKSVAGYTYWVSPCVDRYGMYQSRVNWPWMCDGWVCQQGSTASWYTYVLASRSSTPAFTRIDANRVQSVQTGSSSLCSSDRVTTITYVCAPFTTIFNVTEAPQCTYNLTIYTPLACAASNTSVVAASACTFEGKDYATVGASAATASALTVLSGTSNKGTYYLVSPCTDRLNVYKSDDGLDGVSMVSVGYYGYSYTSTPLLKVTDALRFTRVSAEIVMADASADNVGGCSHWTTTFYYQCAYDTSVVSTVDLTCSTYMFVTTPLACTVPPLPPSPSPPSSPTYYYTYFTSSSGSAISTSTFIAVVASVSAVACLIVTAVAVYIRRKRRLAASRPKIVDAEADAAEVEGLGIAAVARADVAASGAPSAAAVAAAVGSVSAPSAPSAARSAGVDDLEGGRGAAVSRAIDVSPAPAIEIDAPSSSAEAITLQTYIVYPRLNN